MQPQSKIKLAYIAGPYRAGSEYEVHCNIQLAEKAAVRAWRSGYAAICPHKNSAYLGGCVEDAVILEGDLAMVRRCDVLILCGDPAALLASSGTQAELAEAKRMGMDICDYDAGRDRIVMRSNTETRKSRNTETAEAVYADPGRGVFGQLPPQSQSKIQKKKWCKCSFCGGPHGENPRDWFMADDTLLCETCRTKWHSCSRCCNPTRAVSSDGLCSRCERLRVEYQGISNIGDAAGDGGTVFGGGNSLLLSSGIRVDRRVLDLRV